MGTPFGKPKQTFRPNGPEYQTMAESALMKLKNQMSEKEFLAWQYRSFDSKGFPMAKWDWRTVWMHAANELAFPTQCECGGDPDREHVCRLCQSIAHVSSIDLVAE
jgi:hypothetical protein